MVNELCLSETLLEAVKEVFETMAFMSVEKASDDCQNDCGMSRSLAALWPTAARVLMMIPGSNSNPFSAKSLRNGSNLSRTQPVCFAATRATVISVSLIFVPAVLRRVKISDTSSNS